MPDFSPSFLLSGLIEFSVLLPSDHPIYILFFVDIVTITNLFFTIHIYHEELHLYISRILRILSLYFLCMNNCFFLCWLFYNKHIRAISSALLIVFSLLKWTTCHPCSQVPPFLIQPSQALQKPILCSMIRTIFTWCPFASAPFFDCSHKICEFDFMTSFLIVNWHHNWSLTTHVRLIIIES